MGKGTHFFGQPVYGQLIKCLNKDKIVEMSRNHGGERYIKSFDGWHQSAHRHISKRERALRCQVHLRGHDIVLIYRRRWQIESLFKQIKQNFPLRYFYGESGNAIKIQIWVTLIANLLMTLLQQKLKRRWNFYRLATMVRIVLMYYINLDSFLEKPDEDMKRMLAEASESPPEDT